LANREEGIVDDFVLLGELNRILRVGVHDLNEAAKQLGLPLSVVQGAFEDGLLKGHWKVADGKLLMHLSSAETTKCPPWIVAGRSNSAITA
jgi:hypothetical protein